MIICTKCKIEMTCTQTGLVAVWNGSHCYAGDEFECPSCDNKTLVTVANSHFEPDILDNDMISTIKMD